MLTHKIQANYSAAQYKTRHTRGQHATLHKCLNVTTEQHAPRRCIRPSSETQKARTHDNNSAEVQTKAASPVHQNHGVTREAYVTENKGDPMK